jgi:hypothetical protein
MTTTVRQSHAQPQTASRSGRITATSGVATVAATSAVISYNHVRHLALHAGETELAALLLPLALDGAIVAAVAVILADSRAGRRPAALTWVLLALGLIGSLSANIASAAPTLTARAVAAWPPMLLAVGVEVLANLSRRTRTPRPSATPEQVPDIVPASGPSVPSGNAADQPNSRGADLAVLTAEQPQFLDTADAPAQDRARELLDQWNGTGELCSGPRLADALGISTGYARRLIRQWNGDRNTKLNEPRQLAQYRCSRATPGSESANTAAAELSRDPFPVQA